MARSFGSFSNRFAGRKLTLEILEDRNLLSANPTIPSKLYRADWAKDISQLQIDPSIGQYMGNWMVGVAANQNASLLSTDAGTLLSRPTQLANGAFVWTFSADINPTIISGWLQARQNSGQIDYFYPLLARQHSTRFIPNDPQFSNQWHLQNTGQGGGLAGTDVNITTVWNTFRGANVQIAVVDTGVNISHEDLSPNLWVNPNDPVNGIDDDGNGFVDDINGWDFNSFDNDPTPEGDSHGTSVAGVAAGLGNNGIGIAGAAFDADLIGIRLIEDAIDDSQIADALSYQRNITDIYSNSWGPFDDGSTLEGPGPITLAALQDNYFNGRNGLGNIYTWAGGNGGDDSGISGDIDNSNYDGFANSRFVIAVGAIGNNGTRSSYSERGANLLVSAPSNGGSLGITTTGGFGNNEYTNDFGGTSSATPLVSGVIALILEARPDLTARDVQYILVNSSTKVDPTDAGWSRNNGGSGFWVNDKYGFGMVNAQAAVTLAQSWLKVKPQITSTTGIVNANLSVPDNDPTGVTANVNVGAASDMLLEHVELTVNATHTWRGDLKFVLTSPSGTQSVMENRFFDSSPDFVNWKFMTVRNWGESPVGNWTLQVIDTFGGDVGTLTNFKLDFYGVQPPVPEAFNDAYTIPEDNVLLVGSPGVMGNDTNAVTAALISNVSTGTLLFFANGSFRYTPPANFYGTTSFTYQPSNASGAGNIATVTITVTPVNDAPVALNDGVYVARPGRPLVINPVGILGNDFDIDSPSSSLVASLFTTPFRGSITDFAGNGGFTYLADSGTGTDNFLYRVSDGLASSAPATVNLRLNTPPVAQNLTTFTEVGVGTSGNVLTSAFDFDRDTMQAKLVTTTPNGTLVLNLDGSFSYTPNAGFFGIDTFTYRVDDPYYNASNPDQIGNTASYAIRVNRRPNSVSDTYTFPRGQSIELFSPGLLSNDFDLDTATYGDILRANLVTTTTNGSLTVDTNGYMKYVPNPTFTGTDTFQYRTFDGMHEGNLVTVSLVVVPTPTAVNDAYISFGPVLSVAAGSGLLVNDSSPVNAPLAARLVTPPTFGSVVLNPNGSFVYSAANNYVGPDSFSYVANDGISDSNIATVSLTLFSLNQPPVAVNDSYTMNPSTPMINSNLFVPAAGILANDTDPQALPLVATIVSGTSNGSLILNSNGSFNYTPQVGFVGIDSFTYQAANGYALSNVATVTITVGTPVVVLNPNRRVILGQDVGGQLRVLTGETGATVFTITPYAGFTGSIRIATGDFNNDSIPDIVTAPGAGSGSTGTIMGIRVFNGQTGLPLPGTLGTGIRPFGNTYTGGIHVAVGDLNGDGRVDLVAGAESSSAATKVRSYNGINGTVFTGWSGGFNPYTGTAHGGVRVATGDVNGDGRAEIITSPGAGTPTVKVYNRGAANITSGLITSFNAYSTNVAGGVFVAAGDLNGDGRAEIVTGAGNNANGHVRVFNGQTGSLLRSLNLGTISGSARVSVGDIDGDGDLDLVVGMATTGANSRARVYDAITLAEMFPTENRYNFGAYTGGLFVASLAKSSGGGVSV
jgi:subtilisin-like proprotein convertase family protein